MLSMVNMVSAPNTVNPKSDSVNTYNKPINAIIVTIKQDLKNVCSSCESNGYVKAGDVTIKGTPAAFAFWLLDTKAVFQSCLNASNTFGSPPIEDTSAFTVKFEQTHTGDVKVPLEEYPVKYPFFKKRAAYTVKALTGFRN